MSRAVDVDEYFQLAGSLFPKIRIGRLGGGEPPWAEGVPSTAQGPTGETDTTFTRNLKQ